MWVLTVFNVEYSLAHVHLGWKFTAFQRTEVMLCLFHFGNARLLSSLYSGADMPFSTLGRILEAQRKHGDVINTWAAKQENARDKDLGQVTTFSGYPFPHLSNEELQPHPSPRFLTEEYSMLYNKLYPPSLTTTSDIHLVPHCSLLKLLNGLKITLSHFKIHLTEPLKRTEYGF